MDRLDIESRLREAELRDVGLRAERAEEALGRSEGVLREIEAAQRTRHQYLYFRLREIYKQGPAGALRLAVGGDDLAGVLRRTGYLAYLSRKDARLLRAFRVDQERLSREREQLERERERLVLLRKEGEDAAARLQAALRERQRMIEGLEKDDRRRREALG